MACGQYGISALLFESIRELLFNAAKYAEVDEAHVRVWEEEASLHVVVEDSGKGFDVESPTTTRPGRGFGLFSIRERLAAVGGRFSIVSAPGKGTRVELKVPLLREVEEEQQLPPAESRPRAEAADGRGAAEAPGPRQISVLVADDHAMVRQGIATLLNEDRRLLVVGEVADGQAAVDAVEQKHPDVILVDLNMPRMNGIEATREIHRRWPETIVVALSVQDDAATAKAIRAAGAASFLPKAGNSDRMIETIVELAKRKRSRRTER